MKTLGAMALLAMVAFGGQAWAQGSCPAGKVLASCSDGTKQCCMPAGRIDCGNGTNNISEEYCELARGGARGGSGGGGRFVPPQQGDGIPGTQGQRGPVPQGCDPATWHSQGACAIR